MLATGARWIRLYPDVDRNSPPEGGLFYGESLTKYTKRRLNDSTANG
jgi:hypothetical protein